MSLLGAASAPEVHDAFDVWASIVIPALLGLSVAYFAWRTYRLERTIHNRDAAKERALDDADLRSFRARIFEAVNAKDVDAMAELTSDLDTWTNDRPNQDSAVRLAEALKRKLLSVFSKPSEDVDPLPVSLWLFEEWEQARTNWLDRNVSVPAKL